MKREVNSGRGYYEGTMRVLSVKYNRSDMFKGDNCILCFFREDTRHEMKGEGLRCGIREEDKRDRQTEMSLVFSLSLM